MEKPRDAAHVFAQYASELNYEDIPAEVREATKRSILDTLGVAIAASTHGEGCRELVELIKDGGGKAESTILGFGGRVPAVRILRLNLLITNIPMIAAIVMIIGIKPTTAALRLLRVAKRMIKIKASANPRLRI